MSFSCNMSIKDIVAVERCSTYEINYLTKKINKLFLNIEYIKKIIKPGMTVALKPNLLTRKKPELAVTTHPHIVQAVVEIIHKMGAKVIIVDSPGGPNSINYLKSVYKNTGMEDVSKKTGAILNYNLDKVDIEFRAGKQFRKISILKTINEADFIINLPKLKTHGLTLMTCSVKNIFGTIPGLIKGEYHLNLVEVNQFASFLVDLALLIRPGLTIVDAVVGMEGEGPSAGTPKETGYLFASKNIFNLDLVSAKIIGINPQKVPTIKESMKRGLCADGFQKLNLVGTEIKEVKYKLPKTLNQIDFKESMGNKIPKVFLSKIYDWLKPKPVFDEEICVRCGVCKESCPSEAIIIKDKPEVDLEKCIRCYCCQELCPKNAVEISYPWLGKLLFRS